MRLYTEGVLTLKNVKEAYLKNGRSTILGITVILVMSLLFWALSLVIFSVPKAALLYAAACYFSALSVLFMYLLYRIETVQTLVNRATIHRLFLYLVVLVALFLVIL